MADGPRLRGRVRPQGSTRRMSGSRCACCSSRRSSTRAGPFRMLHLDLLVLLGFGVSHIFFNRGEIWVSVPLAYPVLLYLLVRLLWVGLRGRASARAAGAAGARRVARRWRSCSSSASASALNVTDSNVIDVGYAGVIGADRIMDGESLYGEGLPRRTSSRATPTGRSNYLAYVPLEQALPWSGRWDDLPAAHGAAITFDLLTLLGLLVLGRRLRRGPEGTRSGIALAYAWVATRTRCSRSSRTPTTRWCRCCSCWALVLVALAAAARGARRRWPRRRSSRRWRWRRCSRRRPRARAARRGSCSRRRSLAVIALVARAVGCPTAACASSTTARSATRPRASRRSRSGARTTSSWLHTAVKVGAVGLALLVAFVPRGADPVQVAALAAAVLIALSWPPTHWFYLYIVWFAARLRGVLRARADYRQAAAFARASPGRAPRAEPREPALA